MKISIIIPEDNWLLNLVPELIKFRHEVIVNKCEEDCDVIIATERTYMPLTDELHRKHPKIPLVVHNWDWYDYEDKSKRKYPLFIQLAKEARDVWSADKYTADKFEKEMGIKSEFYLYAFVLPWEWEGEKRDWGYMMNGSRFDNNKRVIWYEKAAEELSIPCKAYNPQLNTREDYVRTMKNCSFLVMASREESIGGLTPMEASCCKKPSLVSDCKGAKEIWGNDVVYFKVDDYEDFKKQMKWLWENYKGKKVQKKVERAYQKVNTRFLPHHMAARIDERLKEVL